jgi:hypothetical protein
MLEEIKTKFRECLLPAGPESCVHMLPKNVKVKICKTIILPVILCGLCNLALANKERIFFFVAMNKMEETPIHLIAGHGFTINLT